jgi:DNA-binding response OmpR family regulator
MKAKLLYVEDDKTLAFIVREHLEMQGYDVTHCSTGTIAWETWQSGSFDLVIIDVMLPGKDGFSLAEDIRNKDRRIPILFLTAKTLKEDRLKGFRVGADDYIVKPFSVEELLYKVAVFLKRKNVDSTMDNRSVYSVGDFEFDAYNLTLQTSDNERSLTLKESQVLKYLLDHKNNVVERRQILIDLWGEDDYFMGRSLDVFISRLRKYLNESSGVRIVNIHGVGFKLVSD